MHMSSPSRLSHWCIGQGQRHHDAASLPVFTHALLAALLLSVWGQAAAQSAVAPPPTPESEASPAQPAMLESITINAYRQAETIGAATKTETPLIETPQTVTVIERDEMDARGVQNLNEATRYTAGVLPESQGMDNRVDDMYIRGFDAGSWGANLMLDGMRAPSDGTLSWNRASFNTWNLERVEVLKGPSSVLYGQLAPGGMVNQVTKVPRAGQMQTVWAQIDANGRPTEAFDLGGANDNDSVLWRMVGLHGSGKTQLDHVRHKQWFVAPSVTFKFNEDNTKLTLLGMYQKDSGGSTFQFLPYQGTVVPGAQGFIKNKTFLGEPDWNVYDRKEWYAGWQFEHKFNDNWKLSQNARYTHVDSLYRATVGFGVRGAAVTDLNTLTDGHILKRRAVQGEGDSNAKTVDTRVEGKFSTGALEHTLLAGFDWRENKWDFLRKMSNASPDAIAIDIYDPVYTHYDFEPSLTLVQMETDEKNRQMGVYLQDQLAWGKWRVTLGGRQDWSRIDTLNRLNDERTVTSDRAFTGRAGLTYLADNGLAPYLSFSQSFQPVGGVQRNGDTFKPLKGKQWEAGIKYEPRGVDGMLMLSAYELTQENVLTADPTNVTTGASFQVQTGKVRVRGIELEGRITPFDGFSVIGAVTRMDSKIMRSNDGNVGNEMIRVPDWMGSLWLDYTVRSGALKGLGFGGGLRYIDDTYGDLANVLHIPSYTLFDAALRYDIAHVGNGDLRLSINASNLADKRYVATCTAATSCYYGTGRTVIANLRYSW